MKMVLIFTMVLALMLGSSFSSFATVVVKTPLNHGELSELQIFEDATLNEIAAGETDDALVLIGGMIIIIGVVLLVAIT